MAYGASKGRRPFERASKIGHSEVIHSPLVQELLTSWAVPEAPPEPELRNLVEPLPSESGTIRAVIAIDGGSTEAQVREEFPSAAVAFITFGPLYLELDDLQALDDMPFIGPEDMARLRKLQRYSLAVPVRLVRPSGASTFSHGVRQGIQRFLAHGDGHLLKALAWLLFREWLPAHERSNWEIPGCPNRCDHDQPFVFSCGGPVEQSCPTCNGPVYLSDGMRLYERIDDDHGAGGILSYLLTTLEQIVLVHLIRSILEMKAALLREVLLIKDGPLAFFGMTAPLQRPMRELMTFLAEQAGGPLINLVGVEKSGAFVEHAMQIERALRPFEALPLRNDYIYRYIVPGDPTRQDFGRNTYYGSKVIFRGSGDDMYVATVPTTGYTGVPRLADLLNGADVLRCTSRLRCSMYDNALVPVALANRLVSLADVPSSEILTKFARQRLQG